MRRRISDAMVALHGIAARSGALERRRPRRAFESVYLAYKHLIEAGPVDGLREFVARGSIVVDVGANIGFFSLRFGRWVGPAGRVIAIEPEVRNVNSLRARVARAGLCGIVDCVQAAAADRPGERRLAVTPGHPGDHHLAETGEPVQGVTVDELTAQDPRPVALIKIDVQGAETMVLAGSRSVIEAHRPVIYVEVAGKALTRFGSSPAELIASIVALGYRPHRLTRGRGRPPLELEDLLACSADGYIDVLFLPG